MDKLIRFDIDAYEKMINGPKNEDKIETVKDPALFYINEQINIGDISKYEVSAKIGRGRYSEVYSGIIKNINEKVVIKILKPINKNKIKREVVILKYLKDCPNSVHLIDITKGEASEIYCLIYNNISGYELKRFSINISSEDLKLYIYKILQCLNFCHSKKIMHRDIKSGNIVVNSVTKEVNVIDWGLSEYYVEDYKYCTRVGTRYYKSPELLFDYKKYGYAIDIWSVGCIFGALLFQKDFLFKGEDLIDQIVKVANVFGFQEVDKYLTKYKNETKINQKTLNQIKNCTKKEWTFFINSNNKYLISEEALNLLDKLLKFDQEERITAKEALLHPYFKSLFENEKKE
jgi:casein kinase II subunit alpha